MLSVLNSLVPLVLSAHDADNKPTDPGNAIAKNAAKNLVLIVLILIGYSIYFYKQKRLISVFVRKHHNV